jgi:hypothetical protein
MMEAPRPPYSVGHAMPTQPALCIVFCQATRRSNISRVEATRSSAGSSTHRSGGRFRSSHARNSFRKLSCSGAYSKSMASPRRPGARLVVTARAVKRLAYNTSAVSPLPEVIR